jgi:uncharacterized Zn finger protein
MRENSEAKGRRYLSEGRLTVGLISNGRILATCRGGEGNDYVLGFNERGWHCDCPALGMCAHLHALWLITRRPKQKAA